jgi:hypothetical protein
LLLHLFLLLLLLMLLHQYLKHLFQNPAVKPDSNALEPEPPVCAYVAKPAPIPAAKAEPPNKAVPAIDPNKGAKKGKKASGCPVCGLTVIGIACAKPLTSAGFT